MSRIQLTSEQTQVADTWGQGLAVSAGAGAGKTTTLVEKCRRLLERNPEAKLVAVSFTEKSAAELRERLQSILPGGLRGHWVTTIHGLCGTILRENPRSAGFEGEEQMLSPAEQEGLWQQALETLWYSPLEGEVGQALDQLLKRETRKSLVGLLLRVRELELSGALHLLTESVDPDSQALGRLAHFVLERYERLKRRRGGLDFSDLERGADIALEDQRLREAYHRRFELVLVDEFQDTNPVQARILERFARPDFSNLCVVGDPKQSIYRFRDADVTVFEAFCARLPVQIQLTQNRRSRPGILDYVNRSCAPLFEASGMAYVPLQPVREVDSLHAPVERLDVSEPEQLADWVCAQRDQGVGLEKMALLMRRIRGNEHWLRALTSRGIPIAVGSGGLFWNDPRVRELVAFLRWWDQPLNRKSAAVFLRAPWVAIPDAQLDGWFRGKEPLWDSFLKSGHALAARLAPLRDRSVRPGELLKALLSGDESGVLEGELDSAWLGLWHRCEEMSRQGESFHAVVQDLSHACEENRRERDVPPPANQGQLRVLTVHGSKGLEFDHVILVDFEPTARRRANAPLLYWNREQGVLLAGRDDEGERLKKDEVENAWRALEDQHALAESKRVFYVALTRARERLLMAVTQPEAPVLDMEAAEPAPKKAKEEIHPFGKDFWQGWLNALGDEGVTRVPHAPVREAIPVGEAVARPAAPLAQPRFANPEVYRPRHSVTEWNRLGTCARAYEYRYIRPPRLATEVSAVESPTSEGEDKEVSWPEEAVVQAESARDPRELGIRVHAALESMDLDALTELELEWGSQNFQAAKIRAWAQENLVNGSYAEDWNELAFEVPLGGGETLVGSLDRLVREADGRFRILDYKVVQRAKTVRQLQSRYRDQLWIYAWAIGRLDPEAIGEISAALLAVDPTGITEVEVSIPAPTELQAWIESRHRQARQIVAGAAGPADPAKDKCRHCEFLSVCAEGRAAVEPAPPLSEPPHPAEQLALL